MSMYGMISQGVPSIGTLFIGGVAAQLGLRLPIAVGGALCALLFLWSWRLREPLAAALEREPATSGAAAD